MFYYAVKTSYTRLLSAFWPIRTQEIGKFLPMSFLMFTILFNQNIVRSIKDSLVMTRVGPEVISYIKLFGEMPAGILFVYSYSKLCNIIRPAHAFRIIVLFFLAFFTIFAFFLFPNADLIHPDPEIVLYYIEQYPRFKWFIVIWGKWAYVLMYIMGELWPIVVFSILFWQLANSIVITDEARRFYPLFCFFGQSNLLISSIVIVYFASGDHFLMDFFSVLHDKTEITLKSFMSIVIISGFTCIYLHWYIDKKFVPVVKNEEKLKLSFKESISMILSSRYLISICMMIMCYGVAINLIEGLWYSKVREQYPSTEMFMSYQGTVFFWLGVSALILSLLGGFIVRSFGWYWGAIITPLFTMLAGGMFFVLSMLQEELDPFLETHNLVTPLMIITIIGAIQNIISKGAKYSLFDITKEMAYIPLDSEMKTKGKAAVEIAGMKLGKSIGAFMQFGIFSFFPSASYDDIVVFLMALFFIFCILWISSVNYLGNSYNNILKIKKE